MKIDSIRNTFLKIIILACLLATTLSQERIDLSQFDASNTLAKDRHKTSRVKPNKDYPYVELRKDPDNLDIRLFRSINNDRSNFKDAVLPITDRSCPPMGVILPVTSFLYGRFSKNYYDENTGYLSGAGEILNFGLTFGLKYIVQRKRPYTVLENVHHKEFSWTDPNSFPSGHTSITFTLAVMYNLRYPRYPQVYIPMYIYSVIVAYGRPYFGMHYPSDLLGGALLGAGSAALIFSLRSHLFKFKNKVLNEHFEDTSSINGNNVLIFGGALIASGILGEFIFHTSKVNVSVLPFGINQDMINLKLRVRI